MCVEGGSYRTGTTSVQGWEVILTDEARALGAGGAAAAKGASKEERSLVEALSTASSDWHGPLRFRTFGRCYHPGYPVTCALVLGEGEGGIRQIWAPSLTCKEGRAPLAPLSSGPGFPRSLWALVSSAQPLRTGERRGRVSDKVGALQFSNYCNPHV